MNKNPTSTSSASDIFTKNAYWIEDDATSRYFYETPTYCPRFAYDNQTN